MATAFAAAFLFGSFDQKLITNVSVISLFSRQISGIYLINLDKLCLHEIKEEGLA